MPNKLTRPIYSVHPSVAYAQAIIANLPKTTGRSIDEWIALVKKAGPRGEKDRREWLKERPRHKNLWVSGGSGNSPSV